MKNNICILGIGYVGLPTAAILARHGYRVYGVDINPSIIETLQRGDIHIVEPDLKEAVSAVLQDGSLTVGTQPAPANIFIITVPTPLKENYIPNIDHVLAATHAIAPHIRPGNLVILESTSPVGTTEKIAKQLHESGVTVDSIHIAYCPERILPGAILTELINNDRIIGGLTPEAAQRARSFYTSFVKGDLIVTNARTAEMTKLSENAYRNINIAYANELSMICDEAGINVWDVIACANRHPRVNILKPGPGVGGHCVAVDPLFISHQARDEAKLISAAHRRNEEKTIWVLEKIRHAAYQFMQTHHRPPCIAAFGISYKPNSDDIRESPSLSIIKKLIAEGYTILPVDPHVSPAVIPFSLISPESALASADIVVLLVGHDRFRSLDISNHVLVLDFWGRPESYT